MMIYKNEQSECWLLIFVNLLSCWFLWKNPRSKSLSTEVFVVGWETKNKDKTNINFFII